MLLKPVKTSHALAYAGIDAKAALGAAGQPPSGHWKIVTPVSTCGDDIVLSRFYRSIANDVNDAEKRSNFAVALSGLARGAVNGDYQATLKSSNVIVKSALSFEYAKKKHTIWEIKQGKKDRLYFFAHRLKVGREEVPILVLLLVRHKKDDPTPDDVRRHAELIMKACLDPRGQVSICKE